MNNVVFRLINHVMEVERGSVMVVEKIDKQICNTKNMKAGVLYTPANCTFKMEFDFLLHAPTFIYFI